jgi:hypothetical protein
LRHQRNDLSRTRLRVLLLTQRPIRHQVAYDASRAVPRPAVRGDVRGVEIEIGDIDDRWRDSTRERY